MELWTAVLDDGEQGVAAVGWQLGQTADPQGDGGDPGRTVGAHGGVAVDPEPIGLQAVAAQELLGVEADAGGQAGPWAWRSRPSPAWSCGSGSS
jgi:hypothetical protein